MKEFRIQSFVLILISFVLGFSEFIIIGILDDLAKEFSVSVATAGYLVTIFAMVYAISTPIITSTLKNNLYHAMMVLIIIFTLGNALTIFAPNYTVLVISRIIVAIVSGSLVSLSMTFATVIAPIEKRAWLVSWIFSGFSVASVFGVPLGTWISTTFGWRITFITITIFSLLTIFLIIKTLPHNLIQQKQGNILQQFIIFKDPRIYLGVILQTCSLAGVYVFYTYLRPIFSKSLAFDPGLITLLLTIYGVMSLISNQASGRIADYKGLKLMPTLYIIELVILCAMPLLLHSTWAGTIDIMLVGIFMYLINSPLQLHIMGVAERDYPQSLVLASSLNSIFSNLGISLGSAAGGLVVANFGLNSVGIGGAVFIAFALIATIMLNKVNAVQKA
ncbi:MFS transporter [Weissella bombi]|uniref:Predicted arabinose efflux permease, MFS family n=1 Tax=Weissella bombi TaxID=1505725 RepID=A0A1C4BXT8_9LACO|nr:MFS transporter [Weissella bombi]SCC11736.1 Predicted arabinose efflux permease, MFS family [Weissella bombi]